MSIRKDEIEGTEGRSETGPSGVGAGARPLPALKDRVRGVVDSWTELQSGSWNAMAALAQYEELERIASAAEQLGVREIAEPALELTVYLSTFVEGRLYPSNAQRQRLGEGIERLRGVVEGGQRAAPRPRERAAPEHRTVLYLRARDAEAAGLAAQLGQHRYVVRPCEDVKQAMALAEEAAPDAVLADAAAVAQLDELLEHIEKARGEVKGRAVCLVFGQQIDPSRRHFAQRAGADGVLESVDPVAVATQLDELIAGQRNLNYRVLIVEDDRAQAMFCESVLKHRGITSRVCLTPDEVLDAMAEFKPDLVLLDLYLPGMNGIEVAQTIRERAEYAYLPIVFLSGETDLDKRFDAIRMGGDDFITKPVTPRHLIADVETRIRRSRAMPTRSDSQPKVERRGTLISRALFVEELGRGPVGEETWAVVGVRVRDEDTLRDRVGFVATGNLSQQIAAALAAENELVRPVCAQGELAFLTLCRAESEAIARQRLERLMERLSDRRWLSADDPLKLEFAIAAVRIGTPGESGDELVKAVRARTREAMSRAAGAVVYDPGKRRIAPADERPEDRLARTLLRGHLIAEAIRLEYQALVPLAGELSGQYLLRFALVPPKSTQRMVVPGDRLRAIARELGSMASADRQCVRRALGELAERSRRGDALRLFLPTTIESALDPAFAPWLAAELQARALAPAAVALEFPVDDVLREANRFQSAIQSLQLVGVRLAVAGLQGGEAHLRLARLPGVAIIKLDPPGAVEGIPAAWGAERGRVIVEASKHGKVVVVQGVRDAREMGELLKLGVHYVQADVFAPWASEPNFDFAGHNL
jgi:DNA-binding response OmpR family regulator/EAL domain-containing protein (putative c-di-GMP-specific phosphodiesterase class I)